MSIYLPGRLGLCESCGSITLDGVCPHDPHDKDDDDVDDV
jgi:hypothetical protein